MSVHRPREELDTLHWTSANLTADLVQAPFVKFAALGTAAGDSTIATLGDVAIDNLSPTARLSWSDRSEDVGCTRSFFTTASTQNRSPVAGVTVTASISTFGN